MNIIEKLKAGVITSSAEETEAVGQELAGKLPEDCALALQGDLGSGKTTFVRGLARGLNIKANVTSPTYTIYTIHTGNRQLLHMDAYRLSDARELDGLALDEFLESPFVIVVEWPGHVSRFFDEYPTYWIQFQLLPDHRHKLHLSNQPDSEG